MSDLIDRLKSRIEELEGVLGVDRTYSGRLKESFGVEPGLAPILGMLLKRNFVSHESLYIVLYCDRPEADWPEPKVLDVQICKLRKRLKMFGLEIKTRWGEGWSMTVADKVKARAILDAGVAADVTLAALASEAATVLSARRQAALGGV